MSARSLSTQQYAARNGTFTLGHPRTWRTRDSKAYRTSTMSDPTKSETLATRRRLLGRNLSVAYKDPLKIVRGSMQYLYDEQGNQYLDAYNNVAHVGHCHPRVVRAGQEQMVVLNTNTRYLNDLINEYASRLTATLPESLSVCFFVNSGSEANELALRLARAHTKARDLIVLDHAYHGNTTTLIDISPYKHNGPGGSGPPSWVQTVPQPDVFRGPYRGDGEAAGKKYAQHVVEVIEELGEGSSVWVHRRVVAERRRSDCVAERLFGCWSTKLFVALVGVYR